MKATLRNVVGWLSGARRITVLFIPCGEFGDEDPVPAFQAIFRGIRLGHCTGVTVDAATLHLRESLALDGEKRSERTLVVFGHPAAELNGVRVNPGLKANNSVLLHRWWDEGERYCDLFVAHVCDGARVLSRELWSKLFPEWVSFRGEIYSFTASVRGQDRWAMVMKDMLNDLPMRKSARSAAAALKGIYLRSLATTWDGLDAAGGDALNVMYFQRCVEQMEHSNE